MFLPLLSRWREGAIGALLLSVFFLSLQWKKTDAELQEARLAYLHPATTQVVKLVRIAGPVRIVTRVIDHGPTDKETTTEETHYGESEVRETSKDSSPIATSLVLPEPRTDRWLLTIAGNRLSSDFNGKGLLVGYGWRNRFDLSAGVLHSERSTGWIFATFRF